MQGLLPIYKPSGITSYDVIREVKRIIPRGTKIGHAGTLDPFAEGVLILMLGRATKRLDEIQTWKKTYRSTAKLGAKSDTLDRTGKISIQQMANGIQIKPKELKKIANQYIGEIEQVVPAYAAAKYKGRKLYEYAREGVVVPEKKKIVTVYEIEILDVQHYHDSNHGSEVEMRVTCSSGTYIRQLSYDILKELGIESHLTNLVREAIGEIKLDNCLSVDELNSSNWENRLIMQ